MIRWLVEDALNTIIAGVLLFGTIFICGFLGEIPALLVVLLLAVFGFSVVWFALKLRKMFTQKRTDTDNSGN